MDNKTLIDEIAKSMGRSKKDVTMLTDALVSVIKERCGGMDSIAIPGFGTFEPKKKLERVTVHPSTGKKLLIPPKISLTFKASALLKSKLRDA
ncbi:MAG: HU family DNA-binding protein [Muribaculaceae bacterium]